MGGGGVGKVRGLVTNWQAPILSNPKPSYFLFLGKISQKAVWFMSKYMDTDILCVNSKHTGYIVKD